MKDLSKAGSKFDLESQINKSTFDQDTVRHDAKLVTTVLDDPILQTLEGNPSESSPMKKRL